jgi:hypothetical protein
MSMITMLPSRSNSEEEIVQNVQTCRELMRKVWATVLYDFAADSPHARKEEVVNANCA